MAELSQATTRAWAEINLEAIVHNARLVKQRIGRAQLMAVVKANAYGHDAVPVSQALLNAGAERLCVATLLEAIQLREAGIGGPLYILYPLHPSETGEAIEHGLEITIDHPDNLYPFGTAKEQVHAHLKIDTGMSRLGIQAENLADTLERWRECPQVKMVGVSTHFTCADNDPETTREQLNAFLQACQVIREYGFTPQLLHAANSAAVLSMPESYLSGVRVGALLYGINVIPTLAADSLAGQLQPAMSLKARVISVREVPPGARIGYGYTFIAPRRTRVATLGIGYADGYSRRLSNQGEVLLHGQRAPVLGRICMDLTMVDVTHTPQVQVGDVATLIGRDGSEAIRAEELAVQMDTTPHEPTTVIGSRVPRISV
jgi:alanine racemase